MGEICMYCPFFKENSYFLNDIHIHNQFVVTPIYGNIVCIYCDFMYFHMLSHHKRTGLLDYINNAGTNKTYIQVNYN